MRVKSHDEQIASGVWKGVRERLVASVGLWVVRVKERERARARSGKKKVKEREAHTVS